MNKVEKKMGRKVLLFLLLSFLFPLERIHADSRTIIDLNEGWYFFR